MAVVREEGPAGPLASALRQRGLVPAACPVLRAAPPADPRPLARAGLELSEYDWVICASVRAVEALGQVRRGPWPVGVRAAAVGTATAAALERIGAPHPPLVAPRAGAGALWNGLRTRDHWPGRRVLVLTTPGGRTTLGDGFADAGADVDLVEAYRMEPRSAADIRAEWAAADPDAMAVGSPRAVTTIVDAVGVEEVSRLSAIVTIGETTARALRAVGIAAVVPPHASFESVAETMAQLYGVRS